MNAEPVIRLDNPAAVALTLRDEGFRAKLDQDDSGRPLIDTGIGGIFFSITFFGCTDSRDCSGLLLTASFDADSGFPLEKVNQWNNDRLLGRAFVDAECDPVLDHFILADTGRALGQFSEELYHWGDALSDFSNFVFSDENQPSGVATCGGDDVL